MTPCTKPVVVQAVVLGLCLTLSGSGASAQSMGGQDTYVSPSGLTSIRVLLDAARLGGDEVEVAEITFAPGSDSKAHVHGATEIFYVLEGELEHEVNGRVFVLKPGMLGFVRPPDAVVHRVRPDGPPARALVIWAPGGEAERIVGHWKRAE